MDALKGGWKGQPDDNMKRALVFQAVVGAMAVPGVLLLGFENSKGNIRLRRARSSPADQE